MDAVQRMRARAVQSGKLAPSPQEQILRTYDSGQTIYSIVPVDPYVIYVPVYDPLWIWGPSNYYPYPRWYYAPHAPVLYYNRGVSLNVFFGSNWQGWNNWGWRPAWSGHSVVVNNTFIHSHNLNTRYYTAPVGTTRWSHDVSHRQGVPYASRELADRYHGRSGVSNSYASGPASSSRNVSIPAQVRVQAERQSAAAPAYSREPESSRNIVRSNSPRVGNSPVPVPSRVPALRPAQETVPQAVAPQVRRNDPNREPAQVRQQSSTVTSRSLPTSQMVPSAREVAPSQHRDNAQSREVPRTQSTPATSGNETGHTSHGHGNSQNSRR